MRVGDLISHYERLVFEFDAEDPDHPLMASLTNAVSRYEPKKFADLAKIVENDYGSVGPTKATADRVLHRYLARAVETGKILKLEVQDRLFAYLHPRSPLARRPDDVRELLLDGLASPQERARAL